MPAQQKLIDIAILRTFAIVCVVFFHVYGMMYANHFPASKDIYASMYFRVVQCGLINIAMPLFLFISGYLFVYLLQKGKYSTFGDLLKNKVQRVLLPYFIFGYHCCPEKFDHKVGCSTEPASGTLTGVVG